jgi:hypothetical protein
MSEAKARDGVREFNADDARAIARSIIESDAGRACKWSPAAVESVGAIILWEALNKGGGRYADLWARMEYHEAAATRCREEMGRLPNPKMTGEALMRFLGVRKD